MAAAPTGNTQSTLDGVMSRGQAAVDAAFPPEQRSELMAKLKAFITKNPMLSVRNIPSHRLLKLTN